MLGFNKPIKQVKPLQDGTFNYEEYKLSINLKKNKEMFKTIFEDDDVIVFREFIAKGTTQNNAVKCMIIFADGMVNNDILNDSILRPLMSRLAVAKGVISAENISEQEVFANETQVSKDIKTIVESIMYGDTVLVIDGCKSVVIINSKGWEIRGINEPEAEKALRGPREGFIETMLVNLSMIRRKLITSDLKMKFKTIGTRTNTKICICYLNSLVDKKVLKELNERLEKIRIDGIIDSNYIAEYIKDNRISPFKTVGITERPDTVAAKLLEGRVAIIVDGTPIVLTVPYLFIENFQSSDDYYLNFYFATLGRWLRMIGFFLTISTPAIYIAFITFHREMIPTKLAISITESRMGVPFPSIVECVFMLLIFQLIRESGIRMPAGIGQALSIVGALVIGQSAVEAKLASASMVIVVAITAISGLINLKISGAALILSFFFLLVTSFLGFYGYFLASILFLIHILSLESFGIQYTSQIDSIKFQQAKDITFRAPWWKMKIRPVNLTNNLQRSGKEAKKGD